MGWYRCGCTNDGPASFLLRAPAPPHPHLPLAGPCCLCISWACWPPEIGFAASHLHHHAAYFDSVAFGHFHSIFSCLGAASVPRRCRRHDGADPISFRIKHRFIIARLRSLLRPRPRPRPSAAAAGRSGGNFFGSASPPGKCRGDDARHVRVRAFLSGRREGEQERRKGGRILLKSPLSPDYPHYFRH